MKFYLGRLEVLGALVFFSGTPKLQAEMPERKEISLAARHQLIFSAVANNDSKELERLMLRNESFAEDVLNQANQESEPDIVQLSAKRGRAKTFKAVTEFIGTNIGHSSLRWAMKRQDSTYERNPLHWAVLSGNEELITLAYTLADYDNLDEVPDKEGKTPFEYYPKSLKGAAEFPLALAKQLVDDYSFDGDSIAGAARYGRWSARLLAILRLKPNILTQSNSKDDYLPLHQAAIQYGAGAVSFLAKLAPAALYSKRKGQIPLASALDAGNQEAFLALAELYPEGLRFLDEEKKNFLHLAAEKAATNFVEPLLKLKKSFLWQRNAKGELPIHSAAQHSAEFTLLLAKAAPETLLEQNLEKQNPFQIAKDLDKDLADELAELYPRAIPAKSEEILSSDRIVTAYLKFDKKFAQWANSEGSLPLHLGASTLSTIGMNALLSAFPESIRQPNHQGALPLHSALAAKQLKIALALAREAPDTLGVADKKGNLPLHVLLENFSLDDASVVTALNSFLQLNRKSISAKNQEGRVPVDLVPTGESLLWYARDLEYLLNYPDRRRRSKHPPFNNKMLFEVSDFEKGAFELGDPLRERAKSAGAILRSDELSEFRYILTLGLSNCPTAFRFENAVISPGHAVQRMLALLKEKAEAVEWQALPLSSRLKHLQKLLEIEDSALEDLRTFFEEIEASGEIVGFENRFLMLAGIEIFPTINYPFFCSSLADPAKHQLGAYLSKLWTLKYSQQDQIPILAQILSLDPQDLRIKGLSAAFLDENLGGDRRQRLAQVALQCVECHSKADPETDYPLNFKLSELGEAPSSPQSTEATLREEIIRRIEMPEASRGHMPKGRGELLSKEQKALMRGYLQAQ